MGIDFRLRSCGAELVGRCLLAGRIGELGANCVWPHTIGKPVVLSLGACD